MTALFVPWYVVSSIPAKLENIRPVSPDLAEFRRNYQGPAAILIAYHVE